MLREVPAVKVSLKVWLAVILIVVSGNFRPLYPGSFGLQPYAALVSLIGRNSGICRAKKEMLSGSILIRRDSVPIPFVASTVIFLKSKYSSTSSAPPHPQEVKQEQASIKAMPTIKKEVRMKCFIV